MYNIVFLDFDGVINSQVFFETNAKSKLIVNPTDMIDPEEIKLVDKLCQLVDAKIVISSSWRYDRNFSDAQSFRNKLNKYGLTTEVIDIAPTLGYKSTDIISWLDSNKSIVKKFIILDDNEIFMNHQILTKFADGLTQIDIDNAIALFNKKNDFNDNELLELKKIDYICE